MISFKPLQKLLIDRDLTKTQFTQLMNLSSSTVAKMWKNEYVAMKIIDDICEKFDCSISAVIEHVPIVDTIIVEDSDIVTEATLIERSNKNIK